MSYKNMINTPEEISREFSPLYDYLPPPPRPGIRKLCGVSEEQYNVRFLDENIPNFSPHLHPEYNNPLCNNTVKYEAFGHGGMNTDFLFRLLMFIVIIGVVIYFAKQL